MRSHHRLGLLLQVLMFAWTAVLPPPAIVHAQPAAVAERTARQFKFPEAGLIFAADFPGAALADCQAMGEASYRLVIRPEVAPINNSPWYAFQVRSEKPQTIRVLLTYENGGHRYPPKISCDGRAWTPLPRNKYAPKPKEKQAELTLDVGPLPLWVAAQEMLIGKDLLDWADRTASKPFAEKKVIGRSVAGREIVAIRIGNPEAREHVVVIGRQHPPEVTGSLALMAFVEAITGDSPLARQFRERVQMTVVPLVNPDGVERGYWRCNLNKLDLNRDWVKFSQPETRAVRDEVRRLAADGQSLRLLLDFHSTGHDVLYTQTDEQKTVPAGFTKQWIDAISARLPDYKIRRDASTTTSLPASKKWGFDTYGIPAIVYEVGDNTDRALIRTVAQTAAEEMMRILSPPAVAADNASVPAAEAATAGGR